MFDTAQKKKKKILLEQPNSFNALHLTALVFRKMGNYEKSIELFNKIIISNPFHAESINNLASVYWDIGELKLAESYYLKAIEVDNCFADAFHNLANLQIALGDHLSAESNLYKAISHDSSKLEYYFSLGLLLSELGRFDEALKCQNKVLGLTSVNTNIYFQIFNNFMYMHRYQDALEFADLAIVGRKLDDLQLCELLIGKAIIFWLFDNEEEGLLAINLSEAINTILPHENSNNSNLKNNQVFHGFLKKLFQYRRFNPILYEKNEKSTIYFISESHSFSANGVTVDYNNSLHTIKSLLITGAKIFHLVQSEANKSKSSLDILLKGLPAKSTVVIGFGEIDCRINEGIFKYCVKYNKNPKLIIIEMIEKYIEMLKLAADENECSLIIYGVPSPHPHTFEGFKEEDIEEFKLLVSNFNSQLSFLCETNNIPFLDIYKITNLKGVSNLIYHIDTNHVEPKVIPELFKRLVEA